MKREIDSLAFRLLSVSDPYLKRLGDVLVLLGHSFPVRHG